MKKLFILAMLLMSGIYVLSETKQVGKNTFVNYGKASNFGIDLVVAKKSLDNRFIPIRFNAAASNKKSHVHLDRNSFVLVYKGKEYKMPDYKFVKNNYKSDLVDGKLFRINPEIMREAISKKCVFRAVNFFPTRHGGLVENYAYLSYWCGASGFLIFENPGFQKGEKITIKVFDKKERKLLNTITATL